MGRAQHCHGVWMWVWVKNQSHLRAYKYIYYSSEVLGHGLENKNIINFNLSVTENETFNYSAKNRHSFFSTRMVMLNLSLCDQSDKRHTPHIMELQTDLIFLWNYRIALRVIFYDRFVVVKHDSSQGILLHVSKKRLLVVFLVNVISNAPV